MDNVKIITALKEIASKTKHEDTYDVFLKDPIKVGFTSKGDILCVSIDRSVNEFYDRDDLYLHVIYNVREDNLYGKNCDFTSIRYLEKDNGKPSFMPEGSIWGDYTMTHDEIFMSDEALERVLAELTLTGQEWLDHQRHIRIRSRYFHRVAIQNSYRREEGKKITPLTWDEQLEWIKAKAEIEHLMYRRPKNFEYKTYCEMICLGQKEYTKRSVAQNKKMWKILKSLK